MKHVHLLYKIMLVGGLFLLINSVGNAQIARAPQEPFTQLVLPPIDTVLALAREHSPLANMQQALVEKNQYFVKNQKQLWLDGIGIDLQLSSSNQALFIQQANGDVNAYSNFNNGYRAALNVRLSLYSLFGRKNLVKFAQSEVEATDHQRKFAIQETEIAVITRYYAIQAAQALLKIKSDAKQVNNQNRQMAEKDFSQGIVNVTELARIVQISTHAESEYEIARQSLFENIKALEVYIGQKLFP